MAITWKLTLSLCLAFGSIPQSQSMPRGGRIVGGELAPTDGLPYQVGLSITKNGTEVGSFWCGGVLIHPDIVLTAAHCVYGGTISASVIFGTNDIDDVPSTDQIDIDPLDITINGDFDPSVTSNDIAVIRLPINLTLSAAVQTIQLATSSMDQSYLEGQVVTASGWGFKSSASSEITEELRYVNLTVISLESCAAFFNSGLILSSNICTSGLSLSGPCNGDSGGPLTYASTNGSLYLVGLTSFGNTAGCQSGDPNAYTRITSYLDWIAESTEYA